MVIWRWTNSFVSTKNIKKNSMRNFATIYATSSRCWIWTKIRRWISTNSVASIFSFIKDRRERRSTFFLNSMPTRRTSLEQNWKIFSAISSICSIFISLIKIVNESSTRLSRERISTPPPIESIGNNSLRFFFNSFSNRLLLRTMMMTTRFFSPLNSSKRSSGKKRFLDRRENVPWIQRSSSAIAIGRFLQSSLHPVEYRRNIRRSSLESVGQFEIRSVRDYSSDRQLICIIPEWRLTLTLRRLLSTTGITHVWISDLNIHFSDSIELRSLSWTGFDAFPWTLHFRRIRIWKSPMNWASTPDWIVNVTPEGTW